MKNKIYKIICCLFFHFIKKQVIKCSEHDKNRKVASFMVYEAQTSPLQLEYVLYMAIYLAIKLTLSYFLFSLICLGLSQTNSSKFRIKASSLQFIC